MIPSIARKNLPLVVICGATGTGKSKLGIDICSFFNGEVINADALQLYTGLEIATNKVTETEQKGIKHHMLGILDYIDGFNYNVHKFRMQCWHLIDELKKSPSPPKLPVLVGGTHYYIEAVLWKDFLHKSSFNPHEFGLQKTNNKQSSEKIEVSPHQSWPDKILAQLPANPEDYYARLMNLNPTIAKTLHPKDTRKLQQAILLTLLMNDTGQSLPTINNAEANLLNRSYLPTYSDPGSIIIWLSCNRDILGRMLDKRVDKMLTDGLIEELDQFLITGTASLFPNNAKAAETYKNAEQNMKSKNEIFRLANDGILPSVGAAHWCRGVLQSIGLKEFEDYLQMTVDQRSTKEGELALINSIVKMKIATRQYARRQFRWIQKRFLDRSSKGAIPVYRLDVTDVITALTEEWTADKVDSLWTQKVLHPALKIISQSLQENQLSELPIEIKSMETIEPESYNPPIVQPINDAHLLFQGKHNPKEPPFICAACNGRIFITTDTWHTHLHSRLHKHRIKSLRKQATQNYEKA